jgi:hypothetical protein
MKNHLLFNANCILCLRICAIPTLDYVNLKLNGLISLMSSTWNLMVAEGVLPPARTVPPSSIGPIVSKFLSDAERKALCLARGCFNCWKPPASPNWVPHGLCNCPGNKSQGIPPRMAPTPTSTKPIAAVTTSCMKGYLGNENEPHINDVLAAILPSCVLGNGTDSEEGWDDDD